MTKQKPASPFENAGFSRAIAQLERIANREARSQLIDRMIGIGRLGEAGIGKMLVLDTEAHEDVVGDIVLRTGSRLKGEVEILAEAAELRVGIGEINADAAFDIRNDDPAGLHEVVARSDHDTLVVGFRAVDDLAVITLEKELGIAAENAAQEMIQADIIHRIGCAQAD